MTLLKQALRLAGIGLISLVLIGSSFPSKVFTPSVPGDATIMVNTIEDQFNTDSSHCSLREAVYTASTTIPMAGCTAGSSEYNYVILNSETYVLTLEGLDDTSEAGDLDIGDSSTLSPGLVMAPAAGTVFIVGNGMYSTTITSNWTDFDDRILDILPGAVVYMHDVTITGGHTQAMDVLDPAESGGAGIRNRGDLHMDYVVIEGNHTGDATVYKTSGGAGGGIYNTESGVLEINDCILRGNTTGGSIQSGTRGGDGGGIYNDTLATLEIYHSTIYENATSDVNSLSIHAGHGGGIYNAGGLTINASTIYGNETGDHPGISGTGTAGLGAGIFNKGELTMDSVTIAENMAGSGTATDATNGGGIYIDQGAGYTVVNNTLLADNSAPDGSGDDCYTDTGVSLSATFSLIQDTDGCTITGSDNQLAQPASLLPLGFYGGRTPTVALSDSPIPSAALDAGASSGYSGQDQRHYPRYIDWDHDGIARNDIGAYEYYGHSFYLPLLMK
jgi:CSLREA domain-containing protein